jgi:Excalibur calcium-binding domain
MTSRRRASVVLAAVLGASVLVSGAAHASVRQFRDCTAMHAVYPNGVARSVSAAQHPWPFWVRIRPPAVDANLYGANKRLDRDYDSVACEVAR